MSVYSLKPRFQALLRPAVRALARCGVTANQVTVAATLGSAAVGLAIALRPADPRTLLLLPPTLLARMALNAVDGMLAREHGQKTRLGAFLNEMGDVVSDACLYLPLARVPGFPAPWVVGMVLAAALSEMAGVLGPMTGASRRYDGPMGKSDRALALGSLALALGLGAPAGPWTGWVVAAVGAGALLTACNRVRAALREGAL